MKQLIHSGVLIPKYDWRKLCILVRGIEAELTPEQEEMVIAWVRKLGTAYVNDKVFVRNFFKDFCEALEIKERLGPEDFDFSNVRDYAEKEKAVRLNLTEEEKRRLREQRRVLKEANRQKYGYAIVDGVRTEISNYTAEPSCIFMGRGKHPFRGRWKKGPSEKDVELNLSPDAARPPGSWKAVFWQPEVMWIARWRDKLTGRMRYVWISENSALKQKRDIEKFGKARDLRQNLHLIQKHILENLDAEDLRRRKTATVCYLIDKLKIRVGDEKDPDEADTVGASTLRPEHIAFEGDSEVTFNFLGKDSVPHVSKVDLPTKVVRNLKEFSAQTRSTLFDGVDSERVSAFLDEVLPGLSAKVFRTCYATAAVENRLQSASVKTNTPEYVKKYAAVMANLEAAKVCNHQRIVPKTWKSSLRDKELRLKIRIKRTKDAKTKVRLRLKEREARSTKTLAEMKDQLKALGDSLETLKRQMTEREQQRKVIISLRKRLSLKRKAMSRLKRRINGLRNQCAEQRRKLKERLEKTRLRDTTAIEKMRLEIYAKKETRNYNLGTSLKSYIDPQVYYRWGKQVGYDWKLYYPKALQKKFSWVENMSDECM